MPTARKRTAIKKTTTKKVTVRKAPPIVSTVYTLNFRLPAGVEKENERRNYLSDREFGLDVKHTAIPALRNLLTTAIAELDRLVGSQS